MRNLTLLKVLCLALAICTAFVVSSPAQTLITLAAFNDSNGRYPYVGLTQGNDGNFYGTTYVGGANGAGTVFKITPQGTLTTLYSFCSQQDCADGYNPTAPLLLAADGNFYGTTRISGGLNLGGTIFQITPTGTLTTLYTFCLVSGCPDGITPGSGALVQDSSGAFYGTTEWGGANHGGTVFKFALPVGRSKSQGSKFSSQVGLTTLYSFCVSEGCPDGEVPYGGLVLGADSNFYGVTQYGGAANLGVVYKLTPGGVLTTLHQFCAQTDPVCLDGVNLISGLVQGGDGTLYGTASQGGANGDGTIFSITTAGVFTSLHQFNGQDGGNSMAPMMLNSDGYFYGTTGQGGTNGLGTIFKINPAGVFGTVYSFCSQADCADGSSPMGAVLQGNDGNLYGTTYLGGAGNLGVVFKLSPYGPTPLRFVPLAPCRVVDTRLENGTFGGPAIAGGSARAFPLAENDNPCNIPSGEVVAYSLNLTAVPHESLGYLTMWPTGGDRPLVSTLNSQDGRIKANAAIVVAGTPSGSVSVFATNTTDVVIDINGIFIAQESLLQFYPVTPCRIADTRSTLYPQGLGGPHLAPKVARDFPVMDSACIPDGASPLAYSLNFTVSPYPAMGSPLGYLEVWPTGAQPEEPVSTLNNLTGTYVANAAIVEAGTSGKITAYGTNDTDLVIDINGYFAEPNGEGLSFYTVTPCRVLDTRSPQVASPKNTFSGELTVDVQNSPCQPPANALAYVLNATVVPQGTLGYLTLWPDGEDQPVVSVLNALDGAITSSMAIVSTDNGYIDAYASGTTQLVLDISGYFACDASEKTACATSRQSSKR